MASSLWITTLCLSLFLLLPSAARSAAPRRPVDVPFGRNYVPTWAFDHIKYLNGGSEIHLMLDKYTGNNQHFSSDDAKTRLHIVRFLDGLTSFRFSSVSQGPGFNRKGPTCLGISACG